MNKLVDVMCNPSGLDSMSNCAGTIPDSSLLVLVTRSRDSDVLTESNFETALSRLGGESDNVHVIRFGHWACGWWEALCVVDNTPEAKLASEMHEAIESYPVLDEDDYSERETEAANETWKNCYTKQDRLRYIRERRSQFDFHDFKDLIANVKGDYFSGYASELLY